MSKFSFRKVLSTAAVAAIVSTSLVGAGMAEKPSEPIKEVEADHQTGEVEKIPGQYIVSFKPGKAAGIEKAVEKAGGKVGYKGKVVDFMTIKIPENAVKGLKNNPNITEIKQDTAVPLAEEVINTVEQSGFKDHTPNYELWDYDNIKGQGIDVAVIDSGVRDSHEDLNIEGGYNFTQSNDDPWNVDTLGHGTHVTGIMGAQHNGVGVKGMAPGSEYWMYKTDHGDYEGALETGAIISSLDNIAQSKYFDVVNMSFGGDYGDESNVPQAYKDAVQAAKDSGAILVAARGNAEPGMVGEEDLYIYPAVDPNVNSITSLSGYNNKSGFSHYGSDVYASALGEKVLAPMGDADDSYKELSGTSMASPSVAGVIALTQQKHSSLTDQQILDLVANEANEEVGSDPDGWDPETGHGKAKVYANSVTPFDIDLDTNAAPSKSTYSTSDTWVIYQNVNNAGAENVDVAYADTKISVYKQNADNGEWYFKGYRGESTTDINGNKTHYVTNEWGAGEYKLYVRGMKGNTENAEWIYFSVE